MQTFKEKHYATFNSYKITPITSNSIRGNDYIGPMIIDMYLPALPEAQHQFRSSTSEIQLTLSFAMIGLALDNSYLAHYLMHLVVKEWVLSYYVYFS